MVLAEGSCKLFQVNNRTVHFSKAPVILNDPQDVTNKIQQFSDVQQPPLQDPQTHLEGK